MRIGVVGYSIQTFNRGQAEAQLIKAFHSIENIHKVDPWDVCIVSGLTDLGIPAVAYHCAVTHWGVKTMGVACARAKDYPQFPVDRAIIVGTEWGDESMTFLAAIDVLIRIGGGPQSIAEVAQAKALGIPVIEQELDANEANDANV